MKELELYLHIPFCIRKCKYCDFLSAPASGQERQRYVESLCRNIRAYSAPAKAYNVVSIFMGGGTPSILEPEQIEVIFRAVYETFQVDENAEITMEMNPGTVTEEKLRACKKAGINRLSIGLQSTNNHELRVLGRIHTYEDFIDTYVMVRKAGFENVNIDLMSALPGQTEESYEDTLRTVAELAPEHISAYSLIIEEGTPFYDLYGENGVGCNPGGRESLPDEDMERRMYRRTSEILREYGYQRYEISNYAMQGYECRHNLGYWERKEYLGIGIGAASLMNETRWKETDSLEEYNEFWSREFLFSEPWSETSGVNNAYHDIEELSKKEQMEEYMFLGLRKIKGISKKKFKDIFKNDIMTVYGDEIEKLLKQDLLCEEGPDKDILCLTEQGLDVSNYVMCEFLLD
ncbi:radical SAM family heme chaperone HemW [Sporofaciens sp. SGI.106]|uniref:radical SAM family heme chaperone HemW n=1 Tax=Sporofaciens sp. SGI.106 TaxID=3420568 RepID=UPI003D0904CD